MSKLREHLESIDDDLGARIHTLWNSAKNGIQDRVATKEGHQGGTPHSEAVDDNIFRLITECGPELKPIELFVVSAAAALHDAGRVPHGDDFQPDLDHGQLSERRIRQRAKEFELDDREAIVVGMVVRPHNDGNLETLPPSGWPLPGQGPLDVRKLAALLRLADMLHIAGRVSPQVARSEDQSGKEKAKTLFRERVTDWVLSENSTSICIYAEAKDADEITTITEGSEITAKDLAPIAATLELAGLPYRFVPPQINTDQIQWAEHKRAKSDSAVMGFDYFREKDADAFKGRSKETSELMTRVIGNPVSLLVGASGAGKTSLIHAGLFARLKRAGWECTYTRPWKEHLVRSADHSDWPSECTAFIERAALEYPDRNHLICFDQFEDAIPLMPVDGGEDLRRALNIAQSGRSPNIHILVSYRVEAEATFGPIWQDVAGAASGLPRAYLNPLDRLGARDALGEVVRRKKIGCEPGLLERMLRDLETETSKAGYSFGIYAPYVQMLAQTLVGSAQGLPDRVFTAKAYESLGSAETIIGEYLYKALDQFGDRLNEAKSVLIALSSSSGTKAGDSTGNIAAGTRLSGSVVQCLLDELVSLRLARRSGSEYEIAHDHLAKLVMDECEPEVVGSKALCEMLSAKARVYPMTRELATPAELVSLYHNRDLVSLTNEQKRFVYRSLVMYGSEAPGWYWLRDWTIDEARSQLADMFMNGSSPEHLPACRAFLALSTPEHLPLLGRIEEHDTEAARLIRKFMNAHTPRPDRPRYDRRSPEKDLDWVETAVKDILVGNTLSGETAQSLLMASAVQLTLFTNEELGVSGDDRVSNLLRHRDWRVRRAAVGAIGKYGSNEYAPEIARMFRDRQVQVRLATERAWARLVTPADLPDVQEMLWSENEHLRRASAEAYARLSNPRDVEALISSSRRIPISVLARLDQELYRPDSFAALSYAENDE